MSEGPLSSPVPSITISSPSLTSSSPSIAPVSSPRSLVLCDGFLKKRRPKKALSTFAIGSLQYQNRFFVLERNRIAYYKSDKAKFNNETPNGEILIQDIQSIITFHTNSNKPNSSNGSSSSSSTFGSLDHLNASSFHIQTTSGRLYELVAENNEDCNRWCRHLALLRREQQREWKEVNIDPADKSTTINHNLNASSNERSSYSASADKLPSLSSDKSSSDKSSSDKSDHRVPFALTSSTTGVLRDEDMVVLDTERLIEVEQFTLSVTLDLEGAAIEKIAPMVVLFCPVMGPASIQPVESSQAPPSLSRAPTIASTTSAGAPTLSPTQSRRSSISSSVFSQSSAVVASSAPASTAISSPLASRSNGTSPISSRPTSRPHSPGPEAQSQMGMGLNPSSAAGTSNAAAATVARDGHGSIILNSSSNLSAPLTLTPLPLPSTNASSSSTSLPSDLESLLRDTSRSTLLLDFSKSLHMSELITFYWDVQKYKSISSSSSSSSSSSASSSSDQQQLKSAQAVFAKYVQAGAEMELGVSSELREKIHTAITTATMAAATSGERAPLRNDLFDSLERQILSQITTAFLPAWTAKYGALTFSSSTSPPTATSHTNGSIILSPASTLNAPNNYSTFTAASLKEAAQAASLSSLSSSAASASPSSTSSAASASPPSSASTLDYLTKTKLTGTHLHSTGIAMSSRATSNSVIKGWTEMSRTEALPSTASVGQGGKTGVAAALAAAGDATGGFIGGSLRGRAFSTAIDASLFSPPPSSAPTSSDDGVTLTNTSVRPNDLQTDCEEDIELNRRYFRCLIGVNTEMGSSDVWNGRVAQLNGITTVTAPTTKPPYGKHQSQDSVQQPKKKWSGARSQSVVEGMAAVSAVAEAVATPPFSPKSAVPLHDLDSPLDDSLSSSSSVIDGPDVKILRFHLYHVSDVSSQDDVSNHQLLGGVQCTLKEILKSENGELRKQIVFIESQSENMAGWVTIMFHDKRKIRCVSSLLNPPLSSTLPSSSTSSSSSVPPASLPSAMGSLSSSLPFSTNNSCSSRFMYRSYIFRDHLSKDIILHESLLESPYSFDFPRQILQRTVADVRSLRKILLNEISSLDRQVHGNASTATEDEQSYIQSLTSYLQSRITIYAKQLSYWNQLVNLFTNYAGEYKGLRFHPSKEKTDPVLAFIPINLHLHGMTVVHTGRMRQRRDQVVTLTMREKLQQQFGGAGGLGVAIGGGGGGTLTSKLNINTNASMLSNTLSSPSPSNRPSPSNKARTPTSIAMLPSAFGAAPSANITSTPITQPKDKGLPSVLFSGDLMAELKATQVQISKTTAATPGKKLLTEDGRVFTPAPPPISLLSPTQVLSSSNLSALDTSTIVAGAEENAKFRRKQIDGGTATAGEDASGYRCETYWSTTVGAFASHATGMSKGGMTKMMQALHDLQFKFEQECVSGMPGSSSSPSSHGFPSTLSDIFKKMIDRTFLLQERQQILLSQSLTSFTTSVVIDLLSTITDHDKWNRINSIGMGMGMESLLSSWGSETAMLSDSWYAVKMMENVKFVIVPGKAATTGASGTAEGGRNSLVGEPSNNSASDPHSNVFGQPFGNVGIPSASAASSSSSFSSSSFPPISLPDPLFSALSHLDASSIRIRLKPGPTSSLPLLSLPPPSVLAIATAAATNQQQYGAGAGGSQANRIRGEAAREHVKKMKMLFGLGGAIVEGGAGAAGSAGSGQSNGVNAATNQMGSSPSMRTTSLAANHMPNFSLTPPLSATPSISASPSAAAAAASAAAPTTSIPPVLLVVIEFPPHLYSQLAPSLKPASLATLPAASGVSGSIKSTRGSYSNPSASTAGDNMQPVLSSSVPGVSSGVGRRSSLILSGPAAIFSRDTPGSPSVPPLSTSPPQKPITANHAVSSLVKSQSCSISISGNDSSFRSHNNSSSPHISFETPLVDPPEAAVRASSSSGNGLSGPNSASSTLSPLAMAMAKNVLDEERELSNSPRSPGLGGINAGGTRNSSSYSVYTRPMAYSRSSQTGISSNGASSSSNASSSASSSNSEDSLIYDNPSCWISIVPLFFSQGVNELQTIANKMGKYELHTEINLYTLNLLKQYVKAYCKYYEQPSSGSEGPASPRLLPSSFVRSRQSSLPPPPSRSATFLSSLRDDFAHLEHSHQSGLGSKNLSFLLSSADLLRKLDCTRIVGCKSAKDRTSMMITLDCVKLLYERHGLKDSEIQVALNLMRLEGVRRMNVLKNTGGTAYAFNKLQRSLLPPALRPPELACSSSADS